MKVEETEFYKRYSVVINNYPTTKLFTWEDIKPYLEELAKQVRVYPTVEKFKTTQNMIRETSYGIVGKENEVELNITVGIKSEGRGWFEVYDEESGGEKWYAEGGLWFENGKLTDYDGVFSLMKPIEDKLIEMGYEIDL